MSPLFSLYLDALRFGAALIVLLSHFAYPRFTRGDYIAIREFNLGSDAVVFFFVLSGLVIAYTADSKDRSAGRFAFNRLTRLYSVVLPAILLTVLFDWAGRSLDPSAYRGFWYNSHAPWEQAARAALLNLEWGLSAIRFGSNGPFWSLSYEGAYYLLFGIAIFAKGALRIIGLVAAALIAGPAVLLLLPVWLAGIVVYRRLTEPATISTTTLWILALVPPVLYIACLALRVPPFFLELTHQLLGSEIVNGRLRFSNEFAWNWIIGALVALHLIGVGGLMRVAAQNQSSAPLEPTRFSAFIRWGAGASFSIYLVHYPALQLIDAMMPEAIAPLLRDAVILTLVLAICFLFARYFERPIGQLRAALTLLLRGRNKSTSRA
ncbi:MAG: acyltransferase [Rhodospirillaceae bacterium]|nr:acyltransferase [Rhodospirillaceae bacterium]MDD9913070.1 acyltransferase [Rhodospirillaceae bacterium]MDD9929002.1 acyltransferase [Rhodospirillaceae bacterium]